MTFLTLKLCLGCRKIELKRSQCGRFSILWISLLFLYLLIGNIFYRVCIQISIHFMWFKCISINVNVLWGEKNKNLRGAWHTWHFIPNLIDFVDWS